MANISLSRCDNGIAYAARHGSLLSGAQVLSGYSILGQTVEEHQAALAAKKAKLAAAKSGSTTVGVVPPKIDLSKGYNFPDWNRLMNFWLTPAKQTELKQRSKYDKRWKWYSDYSKQLQFNVTFPSRMTAYTSLVYPNFIYLPKEPAMALAAYMLKAWGDMLYDQAATISEYENSMAALDAAANRIKTDFFRDLAQAYYAGVVGDPYVTPMLTLMRNMATELALQAQADQKSAEETADNAMSYYKKARDSLLALTKVTDSNVWLYTWNALTSRYQNEDMYYQQWFTQLANAISLRSKVLTERKYYLAALGVAKGLVMRHTAAAATQEGKQFGEKAVTSIQRTGTWSKVELDVQSISADQIAGAVSRMDSYIIQLRPALKMSVDEAKARYNQVVPSAQAYYDGSSLAVTTNPKFRAKVEEYNNLVLKVEALLKGEAPVEGPKWGLILGIGAAAAGAFMLAT